MNIVWARKLTLWLLLVAGLLASCTPKSTPPGASSVYGGFDTTRYTFHYWEEGLGILMWHDFAYGGEGCTGSGSTEDPVYRLKCNVEAADGRSFEWEVHSSDGVTADMWIDGNRFKLSQGNLFLVTSQNGQLQIQQFERDFSALAPTNESILDLASSDRDIARFIDSIDPQDDPLEVDNGEGLSEFVAALRLAGRSVEFGGQIDQPFFSVRGQIIVVDGEDVQVFEYPDPTLAETEAAQISPNASSVGTSMMSWIATPHFYIKGTLIVLYVGENESVTGVLRSMLGEPVAKGQAALSPQGLSTVEPRTDLDLVSTLPEALANGDYATVQAMMAEPFVIGYWRSEGLTLPLSEAIEQLQLNLLPDSSQAFFTADRKLFPDLGGTDPRQVFGPAVSITDLIYSQGWGADGQDEAILAIAQGQGGEQYWHGIIYAPSGFDAIKVQDNNTSALSFEAATYRNELRRFEFDYPAEWDFTEKFYGSRGSGAVFSFQGQPTFWATIFLWDPRNDLEAYTDIRRQSWSSASTIVSEQTLSLADGNRAYQFEIQRSDGSGFYSLLAAVGDAYLELSGSTELVEFAEIAQTLRLGTGSSVEPESDLTEFEAQLVSAVTASDLATLSALMDETFGFAFWRSEGYGATPEQAMVDLQNNHLPAQQTVSFEAKAPDLSGVLGGASILAIWDPASNPVAALFSTGWGPDSQDEAFLIIIQRPDGSYAWDGIILAGSSYGGFVGLSGLDG